jgi:lysophospholipase L1-like esterase
MLSKIRKHFLFLRKNKLLQMKTVLSTSLLVLFITAIFSCNVNEEILSEPNTTVTDNTNNESPVNNPEPSTKNFQLLSLGDSYTIGESVCETCRFPEQLKDSLITHYGSNYNFNLKIIARTGWTTSNLINGIASETLQNNFDLVTLLIGVNNQYQRKPFSEYQTEFPQLVNTSINLAKGDKTNVIVISIPDYAYTPYGNGNETISKEIDTYNAFAKNYCDQNNITFVNITDITRLGLTNTDLVASDGLHPSVLAYSFFVEKVLPISIQKLND